jgi:hypothetical protein
MANKTTKKDQPNTHKVIYLKHNFVVHSVVCVTHITAALGHVITGQFRGWNDTIRMGMLIDLILIRQFVII